jgi:hypothetical protein
MTAYLVLFLVVVSYAHAFQGRVITQCRQPTKIHAALNNPEKNKIQQLTATVALSTLLVCGGNPAAVAAQTDYSSEVVVTAIQSLQESQGNVERTFKAYENIGDMITEGKGLGGSVNFQGIQLERGFVADEDTSIYNPGLTLLTEGEKEKLVQAVTQSRKVGLKQNQWSPDNQLAFDFLREKLDPYHMQELRGYCKIFPIYGAVVYLGVLGVQQLARGLFPTAYIVGAVAVFLPIIVLVAFGPQ